jgi:U3 small nucleolar ribonucleoprotein protein IMP3
MFQQNSEIGAYDLPILLSPRCFAWVVMLFANFPPAPTMRELKHHEKKLLKKVDFFSWKDDQTIREAQIVRKYLLQEREDYMKYSKIVGSITKLVAKLRTMPQEDPVRHQLSVQILDKLYNMGIVNKTNSLSSIEKLAVSAFCRRRLPVVMVRLKMSENLKEATTFIEQGHVRVGPNVITDPAFLVTRTFEDYVTWVDSSKIKRTIMRYNDKLDDFDLLGN